MGAGERRQRRATVVKLRDDRLVCGDRVPPGIRVGVAVDQERLAAASDHAYVRDEQVAGDRANGGFDGLRDIP
ncbi:hypothetical protein ACWEJ6_46685 [Nonomuraea sp. NPDC004702]